MLKTALTVLFLGLIAGFVVYQSIRQIRLQIAADAGSSDNWTGAKRYGGKFDDKQPPDQDIVRRTWTPVRFPTTGILSKPGGDSDASPPDESRIRRQIDWCDKHCSQGWLIVVPVQGETFLWFQSKDDAHRFAAAWQPLAGT